MAVRTKNLFGTIGLKAAEPNPYLAAVRASIEQKGAAALRRHAASSKKMANKTAPRTGRWT